MRFSISCRSLVAALLAAVAYGSPAQAQSLLANGFFDSGLAPWGVLQGGAVAFDAAPDADHWWHSGSGRLVLSGAGAASGAIAQCVNGISPGTEYFTSGKVAFVPGETVNGIASLSVEFFAQSGCQGGVVTSVLGPLRGTVEGRGIWLEVGKGDYLGGFPAPPGAKSALIFVIANKDPGGTLSTRVDDIELAPTGVPLCRGLAATLFGTNGPDVLVGTSGPDVIVGLGGDDRINGLGGDDVICGGPGKDRIRGGAGDDVLIGDGDADVLRGGAGHDVLMGGDGDDKLFGGSGDDDLVGGLGQDKCKAGADDPIGDSFCEPLIVFP